jgi:DNA mismatch endonuclease Vsr
MKRGDAVPRSIPAPHTTKPATSSYAPWPDVPEARRGTMSAIRSRDTKVELAVRRMLHREGYRYVVGRRVAGYRPDLLFTCRRKAIFVHGCFGMGTKPAGRTGLRRRGRSTGGRSSRGTKSATRVPRTHSERRVGRCSRFGSARSGGCPICISASLPSSARGGGLSTRSRGRPWIQAVSKAAQRTSSARRPCRGGGQSLPPKVHLAPMQGIVPYAGLASEP